MYAVRQKSTGWFIPAIPSNHRSGGTHLEPTEGCHPRLFKTPGHALLFLRNWIRGRLTVSKHHDIYFGEDESWDWQDTPHRNWNDMEIVELELKEVKCLSLPPLSATKRKVATSGQQPSTSKPTTSLLQQLQPAVASAMTSGATSGPSGP